MSISTQPKTPDRKPPGPRRNFRAIRDEFAPMSKRHTRPYIPRPRDPHAPILTLLCAVVGLGVAAQIVLPGPAAAPPVAVSLDMPRAAFFDLSPGAFSR
jgi:hypothetical protein